MFFFALCTVGLLSYLHLLHTTLHTFRLYIYTIFIHYIRTPYTIHHRDAEFRYTLDDKTNNHKRHPSYIEQTLIEILEKSKYTKWLLYTNNTTKYWLRYHGADHILVMPAPVTNLRHEQSRRGFFHYMLHLYRPIFLGIYSIHIYL